MKKFTIKSGNHYSKGIHFNVTFKKTIEFECEFDESCLYTFDDVDQYDINKLYGFSTTWFHHKQSGRVGWRCINGKEFEIVTYSYNNSKRDLGEVDILGVVKPNEMFGCSITDTEDSYLYTFQKLDDQNSHKVIASDKKRKDWFIFHYVLFPYFGGNKKAPHDMSIYIKRLK